MPDRTDLITQKMCDQIRSSCTERVRERYDSMKELFQSKLVGISEQLEITLQDLQRSLSSGSKRMEDLNSDIKDLDAKHIQEVKELHVRIDVCNSKLEEHKKPNWPMWGIVVVVCLAVFGEMLVTWKSIGVMEERIGHIKTDYVNHARDDGDKFSRLEKKWEAILKEHGELKQGAYGD